MAIRERKDRGKWQVYWTNPYTKKRQSVFCEDKQSAQKTDAQIKYKLQWETESFRPAEEPEEKETQSTSFGGIVYAYLAERKLNKMGIRTVLYCVQDALKVFGNKHIADITRMDIAKAMQLSAETHSTNTTANISKRLKTVFHWAAEHGFIDQVPRWPAVASARPEHFVPPSPDEIDRIYQVAPDHIRRVIILGAKLGLRVGPCELYDLRWDDIDLNMGVVHVRAANKNKAEPVRDVPIKDTLLPMFRDWYAKDNEKHIEYVVHFRGHKVTQIRGGWKRALFKARITRRIRPYDLRHAFATDLIANGVDIGTVAKLMGHASATMVLKHYQHVLTTQKKAAVEALPEVLTMCPPQCAQIEATLLQ